MSNAAYVRSSEELRVCVRVLLSTLKVEVQTIRTASANRKVPSFDQSQRSMNISSFNIMSAATVDNNTLWKQVGIVEHGAAGKPNL